MIAYNIKKKKIFQLFNLKLDYLDHQKNNSFGKYLNIAPANEIFFHTCHNDSWLEVFYWFPYK